MSVSGSSPRTFAGKSRPSRVVTTICSAPCVTCWLVITTPSEETTRSGFCGTRHLALAQPPYCEPAERCDCAQRYDDSERPDAPGHQIDKIPPRLLERLCHDARAGMPHHGHRLMYADRERAQGRVRPEIAEPPLIALDLLAHSCQLLLDIQHVLELSGSCRDQLDQPVLESPGVRHAGRGV